MTSLYQEEKLVYKKGEKKIKKHDYFMHFITVYLWN